MRERELESGFSRDILHSPRRRQGLRVLGIAGFRNVHLIVSVTRLPLLPILRQKRGGSSYSRLDSLQCD